MKKSFIIILTIILFIFLIPLIFTNKRVVDTSTNNGIDLEVVDFNYSEYSKIKLLHKDTDEVEEVKLDDYIACVVSAEMPVSYELEALKAQAIVARTYTIYKITTSKKHDNADICDKSTCCQAWISKENRLKRWKKSDAQNNWNKIIRAVNETAGKIVTYNNKPINAFFHANSGGKTEIPFYVWGGSGYPYLQVVETSGEDAYSQYSSEAEFTKEELEKKIREKHSDFEIDLEENDCIEIKERDNSNRVVTVKIGNLNLSGVETRTLLGLRSANFTVDISNNKVNFKVIGYGHGVGMSQTGADALAKQGKNCEEIIIHFYSGVEIKDM
jgi:stage II sporulation protein D